MQNDALERVITDLTIGRSAERQSGNGLQKDAQFLKDCTLAPEDRLTASNKSRFAQVMMVDRIHILSDFSGKTQRKQCNGQAQCDPGFQPRPGITHACEARCPMLSGI
ncbi:hypothetical protein [Parvibaculum sp.]|uniref:hypothetical protein n=1 Tax=Parvibaculum sp. TaxID=2024848 RepID=UPI0025EE9050|nr:hypothetical protein [Parvibaculum sp.]